MPELPEVETLVRHLASRLTGKKVKEIRTFESRVFKFPRIFMEEKFSHVRVQSLFRRGKFIAFDFRPKAPCLWFHLGMTGSLIWQEKTAPKDIHVHALLEFEGVSAQLAFRDPRRFGRIFLSADQAAGNFASGPLGNLGVDPLEIKEDTFRQLYKKRTGRIKNLLLNQTILAGVGNIYADESLYRAGIDPRKRPARIGGERLAVLHQVLCETLKEAIECGGSSIDDYLHCDGKPGEFQNHHQVYGREGKSCMTCKTPIRRVVLGGRSSFFCPYCQK